MENDRDHENHEGSEHHGVKTWSHYLTIVLIVFLVSYLDFFGIRGNLQSYSDSVAQKIFASWRDVAFGQKKITVVLIDKKFRDKQARISRNGKMIWPLPVNVLMTSIIDPIAELDRPPLAIFVDLSFPDAPRQVASGEAATIDEAVKKLAKRLVQTSKTNPEPIFVANAITLDDVSPAERQAAGCATDAPLSEAQIAHCGVISETFLKEAFSTQEAFSDQAQEAVDNDQSRPDVVPKPEIVIAGWSGNEGSYPLAALRLGPEQSNEFLISPALALFNVICDNRKAFDDGGFGDTHRKLCENIGTPRRSVSGHRIYPLAPPVLEPLAVEWGSHLSDAMRDHFGADLVANRCAAQYTNSAARETAIFLPSQIFPKLWDWLGLSGIERPCVYIDTISAADLDDDKLTADFLSNRLVLLGADLPNVRDTVMSPVNDQVPGVYLHAAALENLISYGEDYKRPPNQTLEIYVVAVEAILVAFYNFLWDLAGATRIRFWIRTIVFAGLITIMTYSMALFLWSELDFPLANISFVLVMTLLVFYERSMERLHERTAQVVVYCWNGCARIVRTRWRPRGRTSDGTSSTGPFEAALAYSVANPPVTDPAKAATEQPDGGPLRESER